MSGARRAWRRPALVAHLVCSVGWLGAVLAFVTVVVAAPSAAAYPSADLMARWLIVPLALGSMATGVLSGLVGPWGLVRYYWVLAKLVLTLLATAVLLLELDGISELARAAAPAPGAAAPLLVHGIGGAAVLFVVTAIAVYKPPGTTPFAPVRRRAS